MTAIISKTVTDAFFDTAYDLETLVFDGDPTRVYRARRRSDDVPVMLKVLRNETAVRQAVAGLQHEFEITRRLMVPSVIRALALERHQDWPFIVLEDFGGESLNHLIRRHHFSIEALLRIGIQVAQGLMEIHRANIIHKDINPSNIVCNPDTGVTKIIDFGISTFLSREQAALATVQVFEGSLPYISPEQTGRMNRAIDYRTDFYSFGATLYELLTRRPLFVVKEPIEWFHGHIAKQPQPPAQIDPRIPVPLSDIVMKLLAKTAEDRYQSAQGIKADLEHCLDDLVATGGISPFTLACRDVSDRFQIPQRLYGREREVDMLLEAFAQAGAGSSRMILVSGYSGIGKTCLIKEIYKPVTERRGFFVTGKFDQLQRNMPYRAVAAALRDLVRQLLTEPEAALAQWRTRILEALGANARLMSDAIQELVLITGPQPEVPKVPPLESEQRFHRTFQRFIQVFCRPEHPLVIFLDDLQWADSASLGLIDLLIGRDTDTAHLLLIGAYRDNEVRPGHPVSLWLKEKQAQNAFREEIRLQPLTADDLTAMVAETLATDQAHAAPLARIVAQKTEGNPFFTEEFLKNLYHQKLIVFSRSEGRWTWDIARIQDQQLTDNVVVLMTDKLLQLAPDTRQMLELAACTGFRFPLSILAMVSQEPPALVAAHLRAAVMEGLIAPIGDAYQLIELELSADIGELTVSFAFAHDRIQQAAYALLDDARRPRAHLRIGRYLRDGRQPSEMLPEHLFEMVNHLNLGSALMDDPQERATLCRLNLSAGRQAKQANAYSSALGYFQEALALLNTEAWHEDYPLVRELHAEGAETAYLSGDYDTMDRLLEIGLARTQDLMDKVPFHLVKISACMARGHLMEAINIAKPVLAGFGHHYPANPKKWQAALKLVRLQGRLRGKSMDRLRELPLMTDPRHLAAMSIGQRIGGAAMFAQPFLLPLMIFRGVNVSLDQGLCQGSLTGLASLGMIFCETLGQVDRGYSFGLLALELNERLPSNYATGRVHHIFNALVRHWKEPVRNSLEPLHDAFWKCLETGDFEYAVHAVCVRQLYAFVAGVPLKPLLDEMIEYHATLKPLKQGPRTRYLESCMQSVANLLGQSDDPALLKGQYYDIQRMLPIHAKAADKSLWFTDVTTQMELSYLFGRYTEALDYANQSRAISDGGVKSMYLALSHCLLDSLIRTANVPTAAKPVRRKLVRQLTLNHARLKRWAKLNPANGLNKLRLVEAELLRLKGRDFDAHLLYDEAIRLSREQRFINEAAKACELCGTMHANAGRMTLGQPYLAEARDLFAQWGAQAKVVDLEQRFPQLSNRTYPKKGTITTTTWGAMVNVDIGALTQALKAIAEETAHSRMVEVIIATAMAFAGAQRGILILRDPEGEMYIEAEASVDEVNPRILQSIPVNEGELSQAVVHYVTRTRSSIVIDDAQQPGDQIPGLIRDPHIQAHNVRSILCLPLLTGRGDRGELIGMLYLENNRASGTFTQERFGTLEIIGMSAAGRLELSRKAVIDGLTELFNHDYFQNMLAQEFDTARRHGRDLALILMDIDHFKRFNDTWGHQLGDRVLKEVSQLIKTGCRSGDTVARYGGEEMAVILPMAAIRDAEQVAERIRMSVAGHRVDHNGEQLTVTISLGLAALDAVTPDKDGLIRRADQALYRSKTDGRNRTSIG